MEIHELLAREPGAELHWQRLYDMYGASFQDDPFPFLNLGYLDSTEPHPASDDRQISERLSERLYRRVVADVDPAGTVLEVGCGRGGGTAWIAHASPGAEVIGLDRSGTLIGWCSRAYIEVDNLCFHQGDALDLPFPDRSIDFLLNVESSHCYPSRTAFFREVTRVLASGGLFAYADLVLTDSVDRRPAAIEEQLKLLGFLVLDAEDIAAGVLEARRAISRSSAFLERLDSLASGRHASTLTRELFFMEDSKCYARLRDGSFGYWRWLVSKP